MKTPLFDLPQGQTFSINKVEKLKSKKKLAKELEANYQIDLLFADKSGRYVISGDRISLSELGREVPGAAELVVDLDRDHDGYLTQKEMTLSATELYNQANQKYEQRMERRTSAGIGMFLATGGTASLFIGPSGLGLGLALTGVVFGALPLKDKADFLEDYSAKHKHDLQVTPEDKHSNLKAIL